MAKPLFTPEELEKLRRADEEIEREFRLSREEREAGSRRDRQSKLEASFGKAARKRKYYEANREAIAARKRKYYEANREAIAAYQREYREANREAIAAKQREYREANRENLPEAERRALKEMRYYLGLSQREFGALVGVTQSAVSKWELGRVPIDWERIRRSGLEVAV